MVSTVSALSLVRIITSKVNQFNFWDKANLQVGVMNVGLFIIKSFCIGLEFTSLKATRFRVH